jgi:hypothetical protein
MMVKLVIAGLVVGGLIVFTRRQAAAAPATASSPASSPGPWSTWWAQNPLFASSTTTTPAPAPSAVGQVWNSIAAYPLWSVIASHPIWGGDDEPDAS